MFCPRCGQPAGAGAAFCSRCGQALSPSPSVAPATTPVPVAFPKAASRNRTTLWSILAAAAALLVTLFGLTATGVLKFGAADQKPGLRASGNDQVPGLQARGNEGTPALQTHSASMPDDIRAWLEHLERTELKRRALAQEQIMQLIVVKAGLGEGGTGAVLKGLLGEANGEPENPPTKQVTESTADLRAPWNELLTFFNSVEPPAECVSIRDKYDTPLRETSAVIADVNAILEGAQSGGDPRELLAKLNTIFESHRGTIDKPALETDVMVGQICNKYNTRKWFEIQANMGSSGGMKMGGGF